MPKELWRSDYTGHVSAGRETALFRVEATISDENARGSDGRPLWMRISKTSDARKLAGALAQWLMTGTPGKAEPCHEAPALHASGSCGSTTRCGWTRSATPAASSDVAINPTRRPSEFMPKGPGQAAVSASTR